MLQGMHAGHTHGPPHCAADAAPTDHLIISQASLEAIAHRYTVLGSGIWLGTGYPCSLLLPEPLAQLICTSHLGAKPIQTHSATPWCLSGQ